MKSSKPSLLTYLFTTMFLAFTCITAAQEKNHIPIKRGSNSELHTTPGLHIKKKIRLKVPDDFKSIQEAVDAAAAGSTILISGRFNESFSVIGRKDLIIKSEKDAFISEDYNPELRRKAAFVIAQSDNITLEGFRINGRGFVVHSSGININHCDISGPGDGLSVLNSEKSIIRDNHFHLNTGGGSELGTGLFIYSSDGNDFSNNKIKNNAAFGIVLYLSNNNVFSNNEIDNNVAGIELNTRCSGNHISNNRISNTRLWGIRLIDDANNNVLDNNYFHTGEGSGIVISRSENNRITKGSINNASYAGISILDNGSENNIIEDLSVTNNLIGVEFVLGASHCTFSNCEIMQNTDCDVKDLEHANTFQNTTYASINCP